MTNTPANALAGQSASKLKAIPLSAVMVTLGVSYVPKYSSAMGIYAKHAKPKDASRQPPTLTTSSIRQAAVPMISTTFRHFVSLVTRPKLKLNPPLMAGVGEKFRGKAPGDRSEEHTS